MGLGNGAGDTVEPEEAVTTQSPSATANGDAVFAATHRHDDKITLGNGDGDKCANDDAITLGNGKGDVVSGNGGTITLGNGAGSIVVSGARQYYNHPWQRRRRRGERSRTTATTNNHSRQRQQ